MNLDPVCTQAGLLLAQSLLDQWLRADAKARARLLALAGAVIDLQLQAPDLHLRLQITAEGVEVHGEADEGAVDLTLEGKAQSCYRLLQGIHPDALGIRWGGSAVLLDELLAIAASARWDLASCLRRPFGDPAGPLLAEGLGAVTAWCGRSLEAAGFTMTDYLQQELRLLPSRPALEEFRLELAELRQRLALATARVERRVDAQGERV